MAKANKSGLGRGLNSLLGGAFEEAAPLESTPKRVLVEQQREETAVPIPMHTEPVVDRQNVSRETITPMKEESIVDGESQVTIKSVVQRRTDEVPISPSVRTPISRARTSKERRLRSLQHQSRRMVCCSRFSFVPLEPMNIRSSRANVVGRHVKS